MFRGNKKIIKLYELNVIIITSHSPLAVSAFNEEKDKSCADEITTTDII